MESLGNYSFYSFYGSLLSPKELAELAYHLGFSTVGVSDEAGFWGAVEFVKACEEFDLQAIVGCRVQVESLGQLQLTVKNGEGYRALCRYLSLEQAQGKLLRLAGFQYFWREFGGHFHLSHRPVPRGEASVQVSDWVIWKRDWDKLVETLGAELWIELGWVTPREQDLQRRVYKELYAMTDRWVAMSCARYVSGEQWQELKVLQSIGTLTRLGQAHPNKLLKGNYSMISAEVLRHRFAKVPRVLEQTRKFVKSCKFEYKFGKLWLPRVGRNENPVRQAQGSGGERDFRQLRYLCLRGIILRYVRERYPWKGKPERAALLKQIRRELDVVRETGYAGYFLIFYDIVLACRARNIPLLARGSAAGSLLCYALGVSNVCPFRFKLSFERFLNLERLKHSKLPDIDLDLPWDRRNEIMQYVYSKYGEEHVAMIGGFSTFKTRAAIADVAKTMGITENEARAMTRYMPYGGMVNTAYKRKGHAENKHLEKEELFESILKAALRLDGIPRHPMMHPCGIVVSDRVLTDFTPLLKSNKGLMMTQMSMDPVEDLGLLKLDLLGQAGLSVLRDACENLQVEQGVDHVFRDIDYADTEIYEMMSAGEARGVFHIESPAMTSLLKLCRCADIDCLVGVVSVIRPGAANEDKKTLFARRYLGLEEPEYVHPDLEPILKNTFGLMVYEEHILLVAHNWAGVDLGRADLLRRVLIKKKKGSDINELEEEFYSCARGCGRDEDSINVVWSLLKGFSGYMFNKAHGAAYAVEAFQGAYLKKHYSGYFLTAVLRSARGFYSALVYVLELLRRGHRFCLPDVNRPLFAFWFRNGVVYYPLSRIKGLGHRFSKRWEAELKRATFSDFDDFLARALPESSDLLLLAKSGALGCFFENRFEAVWEAEHYDRKSYVERSERLLVPDPNRGEFPFKKADWTVFARWEVELLGYPVSMTPFELWLDGIDRVSTVTLSQLEDFVGREVEVVGIIVSVRNFVAVNGKAMKFVSIADETGIAEITLFPRAYWEMAYTVSRAKAIRVRVLIESDKTESSVSVQGVKLIEARTGLKDVDKALARAV